MIIWLHIQRLAMLGLLVLSCLRVARDVSRAHLSRGSALSRALRVRGVELGPIVRRGGVGGRGGGDRRALHDPIGLTIVEEARPIRTIKTNAGRSYPFTVCSGMPQPQGRPLSPLTFLPSLRKRSQGP